MRRNYLGNLSLNKLPLFPIKTVGYARIILIGYFMQLIAKQIFTCFFISIVFVGCMGVEFGTQEPETTTKAIGTSTGNSTNGDPSVAGNNIQSDSLNLSPYFSFTLVNKSNDPLTGVNVKLLAGVDRIQFAQLSASLAVQKPIIISVPPNIVDRTIYVLLDSVNATVIERHQIVDNKITVVRK